MAELRGDKQLGGTLSPRDLGGAVGESFGHWTVEEALGDQRLGSVGPLVADICRFLDYHNLHPKPYAGRQTPSTFSKSSIAPGRPCSKKYTIQFMGHHTRMDRNVVSRLQRSYFTARLKT